MKRITCLFIAAAALVCWTLAGPAMAQGKKMALFSEDDAKNLRVDMAEWKQVRKTRSLSMGPSIQVQSPAPAKTEEGMTIVTKPSLKLDVAFAEKNAPVNMESLEVKGKKGPFSKDLTDKVKPFVQGSAIKADNLTIPEGKFILVFSIADAKGAKTTEEYRVDVSK